jgi:3-keto-5-aminohexanoate cleavage enzyme
MAAVIITVRMNEGAMRAANPNVPWSPEEIAVDAARCVEAGAAVVHFHGRDPISGAADRSSDALATTVGLVGASCGAITYCNLGAGAGLDLADRLAPLDHDGPMPELAPVDLGSFNLDPFDRSARAFATEDGVYVNTVSTVRGMVEGIVAAGVVPVAVAWGTGSLRLLDALVLQGAWPTPVVGELVVSDVLLSTNPATPAGLGALLPFVPDVGAGWSLMCALGSVLPLADLALEAALGISVGLGDHPHVELGAPTNAELVARAAERAIALGHRLASPDEARGLLGLPGRDGDGDAPG